MTVKELRERLAPMGDSTEIVIQWEHGSALDLFEITDVTKSRGTPKRVKGKAGFKFDNEGSVEKVFLTVEPA